jgi:aminoglycoside phosphotransferase (APT) family kinase protein
MQLAEDRLLAMDRPSDQTVLVHGDLHAGNMLFDEHSCVALIDWKSAGVGDPGLDLGRLRMNMAIRYGHDAAEQVLRGWEAETGHPAANLAYWDAMSALNTPTVLWPGIPAFDDQGRSLDQSVPTVRRNHFLRTALDHLEPSNRIPRHSRYA